MTSGPAKCAADNIPVPETGVSVCMCKCALCQPPERAHVIKFEFITIRQRASHNTKTANKMCIHNHARVMAQRKKRAHAFTHTECSNKSLAPSLRMGSTQLRVWVMGSIHRWCRRARGIEVAAIWWEAISRPPPTNHLAPNVCATRAPEQSARQRESILRVRL